MPPPYQHATATVILLDQSATGMQRLTIDGQEHEASAASEPIRYCFGRSSELVSNSARVSGADERCRKPNSINGSGQRALDSR